jgi:hypothetical protein
MAFCLRQGDRPLTGYTIERGVGRGGFGEVYYATSDGGKEVALKFLRDNPQVELRGVAHCLNLKSPHLVALHDVKQNPDGDYFVVMEYVSGPSLRDLMNAEPNGLGPQKAAYFLRELGKGLAYLHDRGIVHRDLKPGNIFYEDGYVKIGDYGLSKFMAASQHSGQTVSVGTVHYMAPEVGSGNYDRTIDIYALGVILYEMLLGHVPFTGATMGEVLMKHLTAQPEVDNLPEPFPRVIRKALEKDPKDRYQTVQEMIAEVFAIEDLDRSVAAFEPASISQAAAQAARHAAVAMAGVGAPHAAPGPLGTGSSNVGLGGPPPPPIIRPDVTVTRTGGRFNRLHDRISARVDAVANRIDDIPVARQLSDATGRRKHWFEHVATALLVVVGLSWGFSLIVGESPAYGRGIFFFTLSLVAGVSFGSWVSLGLWNLTGKWGPRFISAIATAVTLLPALAITDHSMRMFRGDEAECWMKALLLSTILCDWPGRFIAGRRGKVSLGSAFSVGLFGFIAGAICGVSNPLTVAVICAAGSLAVQAISAIWPLPAEPGQPDSNAPQRSTEPATEAGVVAPPIIPGVAVNAPESSREAPRGQAPAMPPMAATAGSGAGSGFSGDPFRERRHPAIRALWLLVAAALLCASIMLYAATGLLGDLSADGFTGFVIGGTVTACYFLFAMTCALRRFKAGLWRTIFRPLFFFTAVATCGGSGIAMGELAHREEEQLIALGFILAGAIVSVFVWLVPVPAYAPSGRQIVAEQSPAKSGRWQIIVGVVILIAMMSLVPLLATEVSKHQQGAVIPAVTVPMLSAGVALIIIGAVRSNRAKDRPIPLTLPLRRVFDLESTANLPSIIERHWTLLGYKLTRQSELLWSFTRGEWFSHFVDKDIHHWQTRVNIAAYQHRHGGYRLTCYLDLDSPFKRPTDPMMRILDAELREFQEVLGGRALPPPAGEEQS